MESVEKRLETLYLDTFQLNSACGALKSLKHIQTRVFVTSTWAESKPCRGQAFPLLPASDVAFSVTRCLLQVSFRAVGEWVILLNSTRHFVKKYPIWYRCQHWNSKHNQMTCNCAKFTACLPTLGAPYNPYDHISFPRLQIGELIRNVLLLNEEERDYSV